MCGSGRQATGGISGSRRKKLRTAFRYQLKRKGQDDWLSKLRASEPDAFDAIPAPKPPPEATGPEWYGYYIRAWHFLRYDRQYGALGGESPISFQALDIYARRYHIDGVAFDMFRALVMAIDAEWLDHLHELQKQKSG